VTENVDTVEDIRHDIVRNVLKNFKQERGLEIVSVADIPGGGTGLGSSSAFTVGLVNALSWNGNYISRGILAELSYKLEQECHPYIGKQDAYASTYGGMNYMQFKPNYATIEPMEMNAETECWFLLLYTGVTRPSDELLRAQTKAFEADKIAIGRGMAALAEELHRQYQTGYVEFGILLHENWNLKTRLYGGVTNDNINFWYMQARANGAIGGKVCGAGGGGFMLFYAPPDSHAHIAKVTGLRRVEFRIEKEGSKVIYG